MDKMFDRVCCKGHTLVELMAVLLIIGITLAAVSPGLAETLHRSRLSAEAHRLLAALHLARTEAVQRNAIVSICPSSMATTGQPVCAGVYTDGWIIYENGDRNAAVEGTERVLHIFGSFASGYRLTNRARTIAASSMFHFLTDGTTHSNRTLLFCPPVGSSSDSISLVTNIVGRTRLERGVHSCEAG